LLRPEDMYRPPPDREPAPWLRLSGRWLQRAGFEIDGVVRVQVAQGKLVITAV